MNKIIILLGQRVRSGTNFVGSTLSMHPDVVTVPPDKSLGEFNLFRDRAIVDDVFNSIKKTGFGMDIKDDDLELYLKMYGESWLKFMIDRFEIPPDKTIFIKSYVINNLDLWRMSFPDTKIAVIYRDGRDNVMSSVRASYDKRQWHGFTRDIKKRFNYYSGRSFINHTLHWVKTAKVIAHLLDKNEVQAFRYEDLTNSHSGIEDLLKYYNLAINHSIIERCLQAPVVGSSFGIGSGRTIKPNWKPDHDKSKFTFTEKWRNWGPIKKLVFKRLAGETLVALNYESNFDW